jgi:hypothetical protein
LARRAIAGFLARQIERLRGEGMTRGQIAKATGIGERTQRKLISGETPGSRVINRAPVRAFFRERVAPPKTRGGGMEMGRYTVLVTMPDGSTQGVGVVLPGLRRQPTRADLERVRRSPRVRRIVEQELQRRRNKSAPITEAAAKAATISAVYQAPHHRYADIPWVNEI